MKYPDKMRQVMKLKKKIMIITELESHTNFNVYQLLTKTNLQKYTITGKYTNLYGIPF